MQNNIVFKNYGKLVNVIYPTKKKQLIKLNKENKKDEYD